MQDEFAQRAARLGNPDYITFPQMAKLLGVAEMTLWRWSRDYACDMPTWQVAGGMKFLTRHTAVEWCRSFAAKHPDLMERGKLAGIEQ